MFEKKKKNDNNKEEEEEEKKKKRLMKELVYEKGNVDVKRRLAPVGRRPDGVRRVVSWEMRENMREYAGIQ